MVAVTLVSLLPFILTAFALPSQSGGQHHHVPSSRRHLRRSDAVAGNVTASFDTVKSIPATFLRTSTFFIPNDIPQEVIEQVLRNAESISSHSWERGAYQQSWLSYWRDDLTEFGGKFPLLDVAGLKVPRDLLQSAKVSIEQYDWTGVGSDSWSRPLINGDGSLGDPLAIAPAIHLLSLFAADTSAKPSLDLRQASDYTWAINNQLTYARNGPTSENGTISQREGYFEIWADEAFMLPPTFAYVGATRGDAALLELGIQQLYLEATTLFDTDNNLLRHISTTDLERWSTGNGWWLYGAARVLAAAQNSGLTLSAEANRQMQEIKDYTSKIFTAIFQQIDATDDLIPNYMLSYDERLNTPEAAGSACIVAAYYRHYALWASSEFSSSLSDAAARVYSGIKRKIDASGWVTQVVDPMGTNGFIVPGGRSDTWTHSPEAQSFTAMMYAARHAARI